MPGFRTIQLITALDFFLSVGGLATHLGVGVGGGGSLLFCQKRTVQLHHTQQRVKRKDRLYNLTDCLFNLEELKDETS